MIRLWDASTGRAVCTLEPLDGTEKKENSDGGAPQAYTDLLYCKNLKALVGVTYDHNIILYSTLGDFERMKQVCLHTVTCPLQCCCSLLHMHTPIVRGLQ